VCAARCNDSPEPPEALRSTSDLAAEIERLRQAPGRDVLVINSASVIAELLRLDLVDDNGVTARFRTVGVTALEHGAVGLHVRRP
jgi:dihydrofolate reductase